MSRVGKKKKKKKKKKRSVVYEQEKSLQIRSNIKIVPSSTNDGCLLLTVTCFEVKVKIDRCTGDSLWGSTKG
jgi:hypothetical protein